MARGSVTRVVVRLHSRILEMSEDERQKWLLDGIRRGDREVLALLAAIRLPSANFHDDISNIR